jgi:hypothetical protein
MIYVEHCKRHPANVGVLAWGVRSVGGGRKKSLMPNLMENEIVAIVSAIIERASIVGQAHGIYIATYLWRWLNQREK